MLLLMKYILLTLFIISSFLSEAQTSARLLFRKGCDYISKEKARTALETFQLLREKYPAFEAAIVLNKIGNIFRDSGNKAEAEEYYLKSINADLRTDSFDYGKHYSSWALADLYL